MNLQKPYDAIVKSETSLNRQLFNIVSISTSPYSHNNGIIEYVSGAVRLMSAREAGERSERDGAKHETVKNNRCEIEVNNNSELLFSLVNTPESGIKWSDQKI